MYEFGFTSVRRHIEIPCVCIQCVAGQIGIYTSHLLREIEHFRLVWGAQLLVLSARDLYLYLHMCILSEVNTDLTRWASCGEHTQLGEGKEISVIQSSWRCYIDTGSGGRFLPPPHSDSCQLFVRAEMSWTPMEWIWKLALPLRSFLF